MDLSLFPNYNSPGEFGFQFAGHVYGPGTKLAPFGGSCEPTNYAIFGVIEPDGRIKVGHGVFAVYYSLPSEVPGATSYKLRGYTKPWPVSFYPKNKS